ncbi:hypothetical protein DU002_08755 [Corallincola holothuriorum]|uniref:Big-1 domain-containing protein n=1 Tax=Corallincola holothuriorum TaxID=2282215 RepID=A0A368NK73_9GAMM|nr:Ig-like domain-containing protein [Corallincola holothuriorum]RCU50500.1 hypothetical protein DU002_08755 [Corallincola holothuriorum]
MRTMARKSWWILLGSLFLAACGGGDSLDGNADPDNPVNPVDPVITTELSFWDCPDPNANSIEGCTATDSLSIGNPVVVFVQISNDGDDATVDRQLVTVATDKGVLSPTDGKVLTDESGEAYVRILAGADEGLATVTADYEAVQASDFLEIGSALVELLVTTSLGDDEELADGATIAVTANVTSDGLPFTGSVVVNFSSSCVLQGTATIDAEVTAINGVATSTYRSVGCVAQDVIAADVTVGANTATDTVSINIAEASPAGLVYLSAEPDYINLQGAGGNTVSEVTFVVTDETGSPLQGVDVEFLLFTSAGGTNIPPEKSSARSDIDGKVRTSVVSGTIPGSARVQASLTTETGTVFTTVSSFLSVGTGFPTSDSFSLSFSRLNPDSWKNDGILVDVTINAADHFGNPVPDGFPISFVTEGGAIESRCVTENGACTVIWRSQDFRPDDGRVTVLAFAQGEESFTDMNGDGLFSGQGEFFIDRNVNGVYDAGVDKIPDLAEAYIDANEDESRGPTEEFIDFNNDNLYTTANGQFDGLLCDGIDCTSGFVDVVASGVIQMANRGDIALYICGDELCTYSGRVATGSGGTVKMCMFEQFNTIEGGLMRTPLAYEAIVDYAARAPVQIIGLSAGVQGNSNQVVSAAGAVIVPERDIDELGCPRTSIFQFNYDLAGGEAITGAVDATVTYQADGSGVGAGVPFMIPVTGTN